MYKLNVIFMLQKHSKTNIKLWWPTFIPPTLLELLLTCVQLEQEEAKQLDL